MLTVKEQFDKVYDETGLIISEWERGVMENQAYRDTVDKLEPEDQEEIKLTVARLMTRKPPIRNFGETSALELLAKLGIFYNGIKAS